jgi:hypothetical protein
MKSTTALCSFVLFAFLLNLNTIFAIENNDEKSSSSLSSSFTLSSFILSETTPPTSHLMIYQQQQEGLDDDTDDFELNSSPNLFDSSLFNIEIVTDKIEIDDKAFSDVPASTLAKHQQQQQHLNINDSSTTTTTPTTLLFNDVEQETSHNNIKNNLNLNGNFSDYDESNSKANVKWIGLSELAELIDYVNKQEVNFIYFLFFSFSPSRKH